jgi:hypothetical protein
VAGRENITERIKKMDNNIENESRKSNTETDTCMVGGDVHYNADTTCFTVGFLYDMCDTSMGGDIQVVYV